MASQAILDMTPAPVQASLELDPKQSLAMVKIFVNASIACICHTRQLLDWQSDCFRKRFIDDAVLDGKPDAIYYTFCHVDPPSSEPSQEVRVLVRSNNKRANCILDMMARPQLQVNPSINKTQERGVFDALNQSYLDVLHVFITSSAPHDAEILETYTYVFEYQGRHISHVRIGETGRSVSMGSSQKSFKAAIRALLRIMKDLPVLPSWYHPDLAFSSANCEPEQRRLGMSMSFRSDCPQQYQAVGFQSAKDHSLDLRDWHKLWQLPKTPTITFVAAHHAVKIAVTNKEYEEQTSSEVRDTIMSKHIHNMQRTSSNRHNGVQSTMPIPTISGQSVQIAVHGKPTARKRSYGEAALEDNDTGGSSDGSKDHRITPRRRRISISRMLVPVNDCSPASGLSENEDEPSHDGVTERDGRPPGSSGDDFS